MTPTLSPPPCGGWPPIRSCGRSSARRGGGRCSAGAGRRSPANCSITTRRLSAARERAKGPRRRLDREARNERRGKAAPQSGPEASERETEHEDRLAGELRRAE